VSLSNIVKRDFQEVQMSCPRRQLTAVEIVPRNDFGAAIFVLIGGTISRIVTTLDASARTGRFNDLDVVVVSSADTSLWVTLASSSAARVILSTTVVGIQLREVLSDAASELSITFPVLSFPALESDFGPKVRGQCTLR